MKKSRILPGIIALVLIAVFYWFTLPALTLRNPGLWIFLIFSLGIFLVCFSVTEIIGAIKQVESTSFQVGGVRVSVPKRKNTDSPAMSKTIKVLLIVIGALVLLMLILGISSATLFHADAYQGLIQPADGSFTEDVAELSMNQIPVVDRDTAARLGQRKLGEMSDLVSQFEISGEYTQINYGNRPVRVTPLRYSDPIKWLNNQANGVPAYIRVDMVTQETTLVRLEQGMKYAPYEYLMRDLTRYLRFQYPTRMFDNYSFEIDEEGTPYWVVSTYEYRIGMWGGKDATGAILVNAVTGEHTYYPLDQVPNWVDQIYESSLVLEQLNYNGKFRSGYWNSIFGQRGVLQTTEGYNYIAVNDDVYLYTGMTSVVSDESNVGFVLVNLRTKETKFYSVPGAEEYSAMDSAQGQVQHLGYVSTFPLLLNVADRPTYFMSLKDAAGLVKMYAFVDVERYQIVGTGATVEEARTAYTRALRQDSDIAGSTDNQELRGTIAAIQSAVVEGFTRYYFRLEGDETVYVASIELSATLPFYQPGDTIVFTCTGEGSQRDVLTVG